MTESTSDIDLDKVRFARQELEKERGHRRDKVWKIFSWAGTLLVAIIGGIVALKTDPPDDFDFSWKLSCVVSASVLFLTVYAGLWIWQNLAIEDSAQKAIDTCDQKLGIEEVIPSSKPKFGYTTALILLAIIATVAAVIDV